MNKRRVTPYKVGEGAVEQAIYCAKMAVRELAHSEVGAPYKMQWRWASAIAVAAVVCGVFCIAMFGDDIFRAPTPMEALITEMQSASDDIIYEMAMDSGYYLEEEHQL